MGGNTPCSNTLTELDKTDSDLTCVIRDARAFADIIVAWSSEGLNKWAELKGSEGWVKRERGRQEAFAISRGARSWKLEMDGRGKDVAPSR